MLIGPPKNGWEWLLMFSPAVAIWLATLVAFAVPAPGFEWGQYKPAIEALPGSIIAVLLSFAGDVTLVKPNPRWAVRSLWILVVGLAVGILNFAIAFAGCVAVIR